MFRPGLLDNIRGREVAEKKMRRRNKALDDERAGGTWAHTSLISSSRRDSGSLRPSVKKRLTATGTDAPWTHLYSGRCRAKHVGCSLLVPVQNT
jgi:hypothetical protein